MNEQAKCELCGEPMPLGEDMFKFHGYSGPCPPLPKSEPTPEMVAAGFCRDHLVDLYGGAVPANVLKALTALVVAERDKRI